jgi:hypothetical protein
MITVQLARARGGRANDNLMRPEAGDRCVIPDDRECRDSRKVPTAGIAAAAMGDEVSPVELLFDLVFVFAISRV